MRIAVCISGQPRTWRTSYKNIQNYFDIEGVEVDYFIHTWDTNIYRKKDETADKKTIFPTVDTEEEELTKCFNPVSIIFEKFNSPDFPYYFPLFYSFMKSVWLKRKHEIENDFLYDIVIKTRFDINFWQEGTNRVGYPLNKFYIHKIMPLVSYNANELFEKFTMEFNAINFDDVFFYSDSHTMDITSNLYWWYRKIVVRSEKSRNENKWVEDPEYYYGPGTLLYRYLVNHNIHMRGDIVIPYYIVRRECEDLKLDSIKDWMEIKDISHDFYWDIRLKKIIE